MLRPLLALPAALLLLGPAACTTPPSPAPAPPPPPAGAQASAPAPVVEEAPGGGRSCTTDAQCPRGQVCGRCGDEPGTCVPGCHNDSQCPPGQRCREVHCIRCPCPGQCEPAP